LSLQHTKGGAYGYSDATLLIKKGGRTIADFNNDGMVRIKEIDLYMTQRVKTLTDGRYFAIGVR